MYKCAVCKGVFEETRPDEEAMAECISHFGNISKSDCAVVCDDCYKKIDQANHPHLVEEAVAKHRKLARWPLKLAAIADITDTKTGRTVGVPLDRRAVENIKEFPYWRSYYFRLGLGIPPDVIASVGKTCKEHHDRLRKDGKKYLVKLMVKGKYVWRSDGKVTP